MPLNKNTLIDLQHTIRGRTYESPFLYDVKRRHTYFNATPIYTSCHWRKFSENQRKVTQG